MQHMRQILKKDDVEAMNDFTTLLLEEIYTNPKKIELAKDRRKKRGPTVS